MNTEYKISGVSVLFPCKPYPSQLSMMDKIIKGIDRRQNCLIESPTGSGKSLALLCSSLAWQAAEKAKQDLAESEQQAEKTVCTCTHSKNISPALATSETETSAEKHLLEHSDKKLMTDNSECDDSLDDDMDDFKSAGKNFNLLNKSKDRKKHISIMYESDQEMTAACARLDDSSQSTHLQKTDQETSAQCTCTCDANSAERKPKIKISKIFFGTRTHKQVAQIVRELRRSDYHDVRMTVLGSREHTCIHPQVSREKNKTEACKELLNDQGCHFKDCTPRLTSQNVVKDLGLSTAWDLEDLVKFCKKKKACPYFLSRGLKDDSDLIICPYNYLVDPMVREAMQINLKGHIVILDEAHNIEDSAREAASQSLTQDSILKAIQDIETLMATNVNLADHSKLRSMLKNLDTFIETNKTKLEQKDFDRSYKIWTGFHIVAQLDTLGLGPTQFPEYKKALAAVKSDAELKKEESLKSGLGLEVMEMKPSTHIVLEQMFQVMDYLYRCDLRYVDDYRASLFQSHSYVPVTNNGHWLNAKSVNGGRMNVQVNIYTLNFWCMNPAVAFSDFSETRSIILTSGTLSPLTSFESELGLEFKIQLETNHVIEDSQVWVGTLGQGPSGSTLQAVFRNLETFAFQDELGSLVLRVCQIVPHGVLCFLPSYNVLDKLMNRWESTGLKKKLSQHKMVIREPKNSDKLDFEDQLKMFYGAMTPQPDNHRTTDTEGAVFFAVCRGKVSEGLDFADNFARAVITVGVPYPNYKDVQVELKRKYNDQHHAARGLLPGHQWYEIQAFRALNQALGRCIRHRHDWGALIIVDDRFVKTASKYCKGLSKWVRNKIHTFQDFSVAMESLSKFTTGQLTLMDSVCSLNPSLCTSPNTNTSPQIKINERDTFRGQSGKSTDTSSSHVKNPVTPFSIFTPGHLRTKELTNSRSESPRSRSSAGSEISYRRGDRQDKNKNLPSDPPLLPKSVLRIQQDSPGSQQSPSRTPQPITADVSISRCHRVRVAGLRKMADKLQTKNGSEKIITDANMLEESSPRICESEKFLPLVDHNSSVVHFQDVEMAVTAFSDLNAKVTDTGHELSVTELDQPDRSESTLNHIDYDRAHGHVVSANIQDHIASDNTNNHMTSASTHKHIDYHSIHKHTVTNNTHDHVVSTNKHNHKTSVNEQNHTTAITRNQTFLNEQTHTTAIIRNQTFPNEQNHTTLANDGVKHLQNPKNVACVSQPVIVAGITQLPEIVPTVAQQHPEIVQTSLPCSNKEVPTMSFTNTLTDHACRMNPHGNYINRKSTKPYMNRKSLFKFDHSEDKTISIGDKAVSIKDKTGSIEDKAVFIEDKAVSIEDKAISVEVAGTNHSHETSRQCLDSNPHKRTTSSESLSVVAKDDPGIEDELLVRRKIRGRKRKSSSRTDCKKRSREKVKSLQLLDLSEKQSGKTMISCAVCGHILIESIQQSDFCEQCSVPSFLRETENKCKDGVLFFPGSTDWNSLHDLTSSVAGLNSKYVQQEDICVQFLHCEHCSTASPETASAVGAQVKLVVGPGARFKKGQMWLFLSAVNQMQEQ